MGANQPNRYKIKLHPDVIKVDGRRFDERIKEKIKRKCIELLSTEPEKAGRPLTGILQGYWKLKVFSDYRVVYRVVRKEVIVYILAVGMRRDLEVYQLAAKRISN